MIYFGCFVGSYILFGLELWKAGPMILCRNPKMWTQECCLKPEVPVMSCRPSQDSHSAMLWGPLGLPLWCVGPCYGNHVVLGSNWDWHLHPVLWLALMWPLCFTLWQSNRLFSPFVSRFVKMHRSIIIMGMCGLQCFSYLRKLSPPHPWEPHVYFPL